MRPERVRLRGHLRDRRFNPVLQQSLGRVAETLAGRLVTSEGFQVKKFSRYASPYVAGIRYTNNMDPRKSKISGTNCWKSMGLSLASLARENGYADFAQALSSSQNQQGIRENVGHDQAPSHSPKGYGIISRLKTPKSNIFVHTRR